MSLKPNIHVTGPPINGAPLNERIRDYNISLKLKRDNPEMRITGAFEREGLELRIEQLEAENFEAIRDAAISAKRHEEACSHIKILELELAESDKKLRMTTEFINNIEQQIKANNKL